MPPTATVARSTSQGPDRSGSPDDAAVRIVYQAVRTLVPDEGAVALSDLLAVTRLDPEPAAGAMNRLARRGPFEVSRRARDDGPVWFVRRTDLRRTDVGRTDGRRTDR